MPVYANTPNRIKTASPVDRIAELINIHRLPGETLKEFKLRVLDVYIHKANATYGGLYNGISRELGLDSYERGIVIDVARDSAGIPVSENLMVNITEKRIEFSDNPGNIDSFYVDTHSRTGGGYFLQDLIITIEAANIPFEIIPWGRPNGFAKSSYLKHVRSRRTARQVRLNNSRLHTFYDILRIGNWMSDIMFSTTPDVTNEVATLGDLVPGSYYVNAHQRVIHTYDSVRGRVAFGYEAFPLVVPLGSTMISSFVDPFFMDKITDQTPLTYAPTAEDQVSEELPIVDGLPTVEGAEYINELLGIAPLYWAE